MLSLIPVSNSDVQNAIKRLRASKSAGLDGIKSFVTRSCSEIFLPVILTYLRILFLTCGSKQALFLFSKEEELPLSEIINP
jgi:hypothetical protein